MSGHSKWHKIQHKKGKVDKARSSLFTKLIRAVTVAASEGGADPDMNFSLRLAIDKAKAGNVPKDNIERAIKRGAGEGKDGVVFQEVLYEAFGPGGSALLVACTTDNTNRTLSDVKYTLSKNGGSLAGQGSVQWQYDRLGVVRFTRPASGYEDIQMALIEAGADDIIEDDDYVEVRSAVDSLKKILDACASCSMQPDSSGIEYVPKDVIDLDDADMAKLQSLVDVLDELDDVVTVFVNV
jgi:YebC/PmpR family DNA-binding regulatory protein